jgi:hypothetical protein
MSTGATVAIIVVIVVISALAAISAVAARRRRLRERLGPEHDRKVAGRPSRRLGVRPLTAVAGVEYAAQWTSIQERFVNQPSEAVTQAQLLVTAVLQDRGYPTAGYEHVLADLSAQHARNLENYRAVHSIAEAANDGSASTEDLRQAMIHYRAMFDDLLAGVAVAQDASEHGNQDPAGRRPSGQQLTR